MNGTEEVAGAAGDAVEPAPPSQDGEAKGEPPRPPQGTPKKKKFFQKAFQFEWPVLQKKSEGGQG